jgi:hypothetical protein
LECPLGIEKLEVGGLRFEARLILNPLSSNWSKEEKIGENFVDDQSPEASKI